MSVYTAWPGSARLGSPRLTPTHSSLPRCGSANVLFFGCRSESKDFYFRSEWEEKAAAGQLSLFTAFSRDQVRRTLTFNRPSARSSGQLS